MRHMHYLIVILIPLLLGCQSATTPKSVNEDTTAVSDSRTMMDDAELVSNDSIIELTLTHSGQTLSTELHHMDQRIHILVPNVQSDSLIGKLNLPGENRNVYISTIKMPDNQMDGPFGNEIRYAIKKNGNYTLIIGPNTRAEGMPLGIVEIKVDLK